MIKSWGVYVRQGTVYVPTVALTDAGYRLEIEPVEVASAASPQDVRAAVARAIGRGHPRVSTPTRADFSEPVVQKRAGVKSMAAFERSTTQWGIQEDAGIFRIVGKRLTAKGGWESDPGRVESLAPGASIDDVARRVAEIVRA
jgi:hypothetical protein